MHIQHPYGSPFEITNLFFRGGMSGPTDPEWESICS